MYKTILHRTYALVLSVLMLSVSTGFTVDMHYCGGKMQSYSVFGEAESCMAMDRDIACNESDGNKHSNRHCTVEKKKCCENRMLYVQPVESLNVSVSPAAQEISDLSEAIVATYEVRLSPALFEASFLNYHYRPPILLRTTPVVLQSFLI